MSETYKQFSERLAPAFHALINDELAKTGGGMATAFIGLVSYLDDEGDTCWSLVTMEGQLIVLTRGMVDALDTLVQHQLEEAMSGDDDG